MTVTELGIAFTALVSVVAIVGALRRPGGCLRFSFLCAVLYLAWVVPQLWALSVDDTIPREGLSWLVIMVALCLCASLLGWQIGITRRGLGSNAVHGGYDIGRLYWPVAALTALMILMDVLIGLRPEEERLQGAWSGPLTIFAFFLSLKVVGLYLSLIIALRERSTRAYLLAGLNILLGGASAFMAIRRGPLVDFGIAGIAAMWFGARKRVPTGVLAAAVVAMAVVTYAIVPLRSAASAIAERTGSSAGLLSLEVWEKVDVAGEIEAAARLAPDFSNAAHIIDAAGRWGEFTYGRQSWDTFVFRWVPGQIVGVDFKNSLMFQEGADFEQIAANYSYSRIGGTTSTGFGFAYQEFGLFGAIYFLLIGVVMGHLWARAETDDMWSQALYVSFAGGALLSVTHHAMWLIIQIPLFVIAISAMKLMAGRGAAARGPDSGYTLVRR
jgi:hypothetical protein